MSSTQKSVFILGGGFAGIRIAHLLSKAKKDIQITLVDRNPYHVNSPVLYEVANAYVNWEREAVGRVLTEASSAPYEKILDGTEVAFLQATISNIDAVKRKFYLTDGREQEADYLVLALGSQTQTSIVSGANNYAFLLRDIEQAAVLRSHIVSLFLRHRISPLSLQQKVFTFVIAGGGAAGVEYAAELSLFLRKLCLLHKVDHEVPKIIICEASDFVLHDCPNILRERGHERLRDLGVQMRARTKITAVHADYVETSDGQNINTQTTIWFAGLRVNDVLLRSNFPINTTGGLIVKPTLEVQGTTNIFAAGDCTYFSDPITNRVAPDVVWAALEQGSVVAENVLRRIEQKPLVSYYSTKRPLFITVGGKFVLARLGPYHFSGFWAWVVKQFLDLRYLWSILPNLLAVKFWFKSMRVRISNDK